MNAIQAFLSAESFAVAGASTRREKYGNKILRALMQHGMKVYPLNPASEVVEGLQAFASLHDLPTQPQSLSIVTPPIVTRKIVEQAISGGVKHVWMQPGAEDAEASRMAREAGMNVIDDGSCILVLLAYRN
jgi:predicted CoA-binding protein